MMMMLPAGSVRFGAVRLVVCPVCVSFCPLLLPLPHTAVVGVCNNKSRKKHVSTFLYIHIIQHKM